jgi:hypothetical protein
MLVVTDRQVHAEFAALTGARIEVVRYDRAGKWYFEGPNGRRRVPVREAAARAVHGRVYFGRSGGRQFDHLVRVKQNVGGS